jgi:hypothetical protein
MNRTWNDVGVPRGRWSREGEPSGDEAKRVNREIDDAMRGVIDDVTKRIPEHNAKFGRGAQSDTMPTTRSRGWANPQPLRTPLDGTYGQCVIEDLINKELPPSDFQRRQHLIQVMNRWSACASSAEREKAKEELAAKLGSDLSALAQMGLGLAREIVEAQAAKPE